MRRHRLAERFLTDMLGLSWAVAHKEAGKWEHVISDEVEAAIVRVLDDPDHVPARQPDPRLRLPRPRPRSPSATSPSAAASPSTRIPEELEFTPGLLEFLEGSEILPGRNGTVTAASPDGTTTVEIDGHHVGIGAFAAARILVTAG